MSAALSAHQMLPQAESPAGCPQLCPAPALCPSSAHSVPLPSLLSWSRPSQSSWALTLPGTVPGASLPHPPAPPALSHLLPAAAVHAVSAPSCSWAAFPGRRCFRNTTCTWMATSAPQVTKMPYPGLTGCSAGPQNSPESPFVVYLPSPQPQDKPEHLGSLMTSDDSGLSTLALVFELCYPST